jgi:hypothetical protein
MNPERLKKLCVEALRSQRQQYAFAANTRKIYKADNPHAVRAEKIYDELTEAINDLLNPSQFSLFQETNMKHKSKLKIARPFPKDAKRVIHPTLGIRCWLIGGKYYKNKSDFTNPPIVAYAKADDGTDVKALPFHADTSMPA